MLGIGILYGKAAGLRGRAALLVLAAGAISMSPAARATSFTLTTAPDPPMERVFEGKPGPWGQLHYTRIAIDPPEESLAVDPNVRYDTVPWAFRGYFPAQVQDLFRKAALSPEQLETILNKTRWEKLPPGTLVFADRDFILSLSPESRRIIYSVLERFEENPFQHQPFSFHPELLEEQFFHTGVSEATIAAFKRLLYPHGKSVRFADAGVFLDTLKDEGEKKRFFRAISRRCTLLVRLKVSPDSDIDRMLEYWDFTGRLKELRPLLESLARVPEGTRIDIAHILPAFARKRIYTFPRADDTRAADHNCHWTAFNFFNDPADERFCQSEVIQKTAQTDYDPVTGDWRLGDILVLFDAAGDAVHSMVYVADDVVYTKNGGGKNQPWLYMHLRDVLDLYLSADGSANGLQMMVYRKKNIIPPAH